MIRGYLTIEKWLDDELRNWGRWCWLGAEPGPTVARTCASYERNYVRRNDEDENHEDPPPKPYEPSAKLVNSVWRDLPDPQRKVLRMEYPQRRQWEASKQGHRTAARLVGLKYREYIKNLVKGVDRVRKAFQAQWLD